MALTIKPVLKCALYLCTCFSLSCEKPYEFPSCDCYYIMSAFTNAAEAGARSFAGRLDNGSLEIKRDSMRFKYIEWTKKGDVVLYKQRLDNTVLEAYRRIFYYDNIRPHGYFVFEISFIDDVGNIETVIFTYDLSNTQFFKWEKCV